MWPTPCEKCWLRQISAYNISSVRDSQKIQLCRKGNRPRVFQRAIDGVRMLPLTCPKSPKEWLKHRFFSFSEWNSISVEKIQLWRIGNRPRVFQWAIDGVRMLPLTCPKSPKGWLNTDFSVFFGIKFNFNRIKSATKFRCAKTSRSKVV